jgi:hypothetical protein
MQGLSEQNGSSSRCERGREGGKSVIVSEIYYIFYLLVWVVSEIYYIFYLLVWVVSEIN